MKIDSSSAKQNQGDGLEANCYEIELGWSVEDVLWLRPHLTPEQACEVLEAFESRHDCDIGIDWLGLEWTADELFPCPESRE